MKNKINCKYGNAIYTNMINDIPHYNECSIQFFK